MKIHFLHLFCDYVYDICDGQCLFLTHYCLLSFNTFTNTDTTVKKLEGSQETLPKHIRTNNKYRPVNSYIHCIGDRSVIKCIQKFKKEVWHAFSGHASGGLVEPHSQVCGLGVLENSVGNSGPSGAWSPHAVYVTCCYLGPHLQRVGHSCTYLYICCVYKLFLKFF